MNIQFIFVKETVTVRVIQSWNDAVPTYCIHAVGKNIFKLRNHPVGPFDRHEGVAQGKDLLAFEEGMSSNKNVGDVARFEGPCIRSGNVPAVASKPAEEQAYVSALDGNGIALVSGRDFPPGILDEPVHKRANRIREGSIDSDTGDPAVAAIGCGYGKSDDGWLAGYVGPVWR